MELALALTVARHRFLRTTIIDNLYQTSKYALFSSSTDSFIDNLILDEGSKRELSLFKYFQTNPLMTVLPRRTAVDNQLMISNDNKSIAYLVDRIEADIEGKGPHPNEISRLNCFVIYFAKNGNINGIKAVQFILKKHHRSYFDEQSQYQHYLAEALWINGKVDDSLKLFSIAYDNVHVRSKVKLMLKSLFPLLTTQYGEGTLRKSVLMIENFTLEKQDPIILALLWKELFLSTWFSDQEIAKQVLEKNLNLLQMIQWMIPGMGKEFLKNHKIEDFYRLLELSLKYGLKPFERTLIRLLFDYYYIHQNIERCSAVVKYSANSDTPLSDEQQQRYINLLLKSKNSVSSKSNIKKPQLLKFKF